jgi:hypothetical protein
MSLTETSKIDKIEVVENCIIQVRRATIIQKDGVEIAKTYHRHTLNPGDELLKEDLMVQDIAKAVWTEKVINDYKALFAAK